MEEEIDYQKDLQTSSPLKPHWLKRDYVTFVQAVFIYYNIEPIPELLWQGPIEDCLQLIDKEYLWEILGGSELASIHYEGRGLHLKSFVNFLQRKEIPIPAHLKFLCDSENQKEIGPAVEKESILNYDLTKMRPIQLQTLIGRAYAAQLWKDGNKQSANALVESKGFKDLMKLIKADNVAAETQASWISDMSPRSKKG